MFKLKTALIVQKVTPIDAGGFDNLALTGQALNADVVPYDKIDYNNILKYQCIIVVDNKNYRLFDGIPQKIRQIHPRVLLGWHQESEVSNIFRRHKQHGDKVSPEESFCISSLKVWESIQVCDFVICHNEDDYSLSLYKIISNNKPCFSLYPFLPDKQFKEHYLSREEKENKIFLGFNYGWREGGLLAYLVAGQEKYKNYELFRRFRGYWPTALSEHKTDEIIQNNFYKREVKTHVGCDRLSLAKVFAKTKVAINLREPTASRTNAVCAAVGTPMIGNEQSDVQRLLFPDLSVNKFDLSKIDLLLDKLLNDNDFYDEQVNYALNKLHLINIENSTKQLQENILKVWDKKK